MPSDGERLARIETLVEATREDVAEIKEDVRGMSSVVHATTRRCDVLDERVTRTTWLLAAVQAIAAALGIAINPT